MAAAKRTRWVCPLCDHAHMGPLRPRNNNIVRYCLPCSASEGVLVLRTAPVLEARREVRATKAKAQRAAKAKRAKARAHERTHIVLTDAAGRIVEVNPDKAVHEIASKAGMHSPCLTWKRRGDMFNSGRAWQGHIHLSIGNDSLEDFCALVAHELGHVKAGPYAKHSDRWRDAYEAIVKANWHLNGVYRGGVNHHRYAIDTEIERKLRYESENPKRKKPLIGREIKVDRQTNA